MFKKKEKKTSGGTSTYQETTTTVLEENNGTVITRKVSSQSSQVHSTSREERSFSISHSSSAGNFPSLLSTDRRLSLTSSSSPIGSGSKLFGSGSTNIGNSLAPRTDALPFNSSSASSRIPASAGSETVGFAYPRTTFRSPSNTSFTYESPFYRSGSLSSRLGQPVLGSIATQNAAQNQNVAHSAPSATSIIPTYLHKSKYLGKALIINNVKFVGEKEEREGAEKDSKDLVELLKKIGFKVEHKMDLKAKDMAKRVKEFSKSDFTRHDISLVVIMSHGNNLTSDGTKMNMVRGGFTQIVGTDNSPVLTEDIIEQFTEPNCHSSLKGKPKIFIFQCCRGEKDLEICHDVAPIKKQYKKYSDVLLAFSTLPGYLSNRNPKTGTWYIQSICEVFEKHFKTYHVEDLLKIVDEQLSNKHPRYTQTSTYENRGFKLCYLFKTTT